VANNFEDGHKSRFPHFRIRLVLNHYFSLRSKQETPHKAGIISHRIYPVEKYDYLSLQCGFNRRGFSCYKNKIYAESLFFASLKKRVPARYIKINETFFNKNLYKYIRRKKN